MNIGGIAIIGGGTGIGMAMVFDSSAPWSMRLLGGMMALLGISTLALHFLLKIKGKSAN